MQRRDGRSNWVIAAAIIAAAACGSSEGGDGGDGGSGGTGTGTTTTSSSSSGSGGGLGVGQCREEADCAPGSGMCLAPGGFESCGACQMAADPCLDDDACKGEGEHYICTPVGCACDGAQTECAPGCTDQEQCGAGRFCSATYRCEADTCISDAECIDNFMCQTPSNDPRCVRRTCSSDLECEGYCVLGRCYDTPGTCGELPG